MCNDIRMRQTHIVVAKLAVEFLGRLMYNKFGLNQDNLMCELSIAPTILGL